MKDRLTKMNLKYLLIIFIIVIILGIGITYAISVWGSGNTVLSGNTMCFDILYTKGQDINFGTINSSGEVENGMSATAEFDSSKSASTTVGYARQNQCLLYGKGTITVNISTSNTVNLSLGGLKYKVINNTTGEEVSSGSILNTGNTIIYDNFYIIDSTTYTIYLWLDANNIDNTYLETSFSGSIDSTVISTKEYGKINEPTPLVTYVSNLFNKASKTTVTTAGDEKITQASSVSLMKDSFGNIRYYGSSPNNYVSFNDETWRIIGVFEVEDENGNTEQRIKIIRDESIGSYAYDTNNYINDWSTSSLKTYLNGDYYSGFTTDAKGMIGQTKYYLGGSSSLSGLYADDYYTFERGEEVPDGNETIWTGNIGIMYPSDYGYGTDLSICTYDLFHYDVSECYENDWLYSGIDEWTISPHSSFSGLAFVVSSEGYVGFNGVDSELGVRPVLYLKSDIAIVGGSGTVDDKYILG